jgi:hypothetical protein
MVYRARVAGTFTSFATKCSTLKNGRFYHKEALEATGRTVATAKMEEMVKVQPQNGANQISNQNSQLCQDGMAAIQLQP